MAALMSSAPGPISVSQYNGGSNGDRNGGAGLTSPRQQSQPAHSIHSTMRSPTSEQQQQTRSQRTVRVQQPANNQPETSNPQQPRSRGGTSAGGGASGTAAQPSRSSRQQQASSQAPQSQQHPTLNPQTSSRSGGGNNNNGPSRPEPPPRESSQSRTPTAGGSTRNSTFPHAFERWEMLSSRWEGLTGYWISKLEQNRHEFNHLPLEQQMSRQIADLSAAGANLFHAVVELQRLRASSERKFQRWFFETRADQERSREISSELEASLRVERQKRAEAMATVARLEKEKKTAEKLVEEFKRELQISREECRRSWEELGRREQEERERRNSLREGNPTLVGDYQVLPMPMPGMPVPTTTSRSTGGTSRRPQSSSGGHGNEGVTLEHIMHHHDPAHSHSYGAEHLAPGSSRHGSHSPLGYPSPSQSQRPGTSAQAQKPFYSHLSNPTINDNANTANNADNRPYSPGAESVAESFVTNDHEDLANQPDYPSSPPPQRRRRPDSVTETDMSDEEAINTVPGAEFGGNLLVDYQRDEKGDLVLDNKGDPIIVSYRHSRIDPEDAVYPDYEGGWTPPAPLPPMGGMGGVGVGGYSSYTGWEGITRHHHPTRLSDVVEEEDER